MQKIAASFLTVWLLCLNVHSQQIAIPSSPVISTLPEWAQEMYSSDPNMFAVDSLYRIYYASHTFEQTSHTAYYRIWRHENINYVNELGFIRKPSIQDQLRMRNEHLTASHTLSTWTLVGPEKVFNGSGTRVGEQTNTYSFSQCLSYPNYCFAGTEPGEIYRSTDAGANWQLMTLNDPLGGSVSAICVAPSDSSKVYAGSGDFIFVSNDAGVTWNVSLSVSGLYANEIMVYPSDPNIAFVAANKGFFKTTNGGATWTTVYSQSCWDVKMRPSTANVLYLVKNNPSQLKSEFFLSTDTGSTFTLQSNGWYNSNDPARFDGGCRLAVSAADPLRVYAYLIGDSKPNDFGYIGLYRSNDGGVTWTLPNGPDGGPYTASHLNLAYGMPSWTYNQGFYNCALIADPANADHILIGGLNIYRSDDGASSFTSVAGYIGGPLDIHVDQQDFRQGVGGTWITNDGGIYFSTDFFNSNFNVRMDGIHGSEFWGFGEGWNEDVMIGGLYHNGVVAYHENYPANEFIELGGGEPASGYVNPGVNRKVYSSEIGGAILPWALGQSPQYISFGMSPNESYWAAEASEMKFDPRCYSIAWIGNENKLYRSTDAASSFNLAYTFGTNVNSRLSYFEIAHTNADVMYVVQRPASGTQGNIWKSTDGGTSFAALTIPAGNSSRIVLTVAPDDENIIWIAYPSGANGFKVFKSINGGTTWNNITTNDLNGQEIRSIQCVGATDGGVYVATYSSVYYHNNSMSNWLNDNSGLPSVLNSLYLRPFYRDGEIRVSSYGKGIWSNSFIDQPAYPIAQAQVDKLNYTLSCTTDTFHFEDHSILNHTGASWSWSFPGGSPATSTVRNPNVVYSTPGTYVATLVITDNLAQTDTSTLTINVSAYALNTNLVEDFQGAFPPPGWSIVSPNAGAQWSLSTTAGGYGASTQSTIFDNYNNDSQGNYDDLNIRVDMTQQVTHFLKFDYAYAEYGFPYSDSLEILVSTDCGTTFTSLWQKGGSQLATAPSNTGSTFVPTSTQWTTDSIDLATWQTNTDVMIAFRNHGYYGQALYVDNINLNVPNGIAEHHNSNGFAVLSPNPVLAGQSLQLQSDRNELFTVEIFDASGKLLLREQHHRGDMISTPQSMTPGMYFYRLTSETMIRNNKFVVQ